MRIIINTGDVIMKTSELIKILKSHGCAFVRSGGNHDMWYSPATGCQFLVGRHAKEIKTGTANAILRQAGISLER